MNKKTTPNNNPPDSPETEWTGAAKIRELMHERLVWLIDLMNRLEESIVLADWVLEKLKQDLFQVLENPSEYAHVTVEFDRDWDIWSHSWLLNYSEPWTNTDAIWPIITMLSSGTYPNTKTVITDIKFEKWELPWWAKK